MAAGETGPRNMAVVGVVRARERGMALQIPLSPVKPMNLDMWQARPGRATWRWWTSCATASAAWRCKTP